MKSRTRSLVLVLMAAALAQGGPAAAASSEEQSLTELRNTVINLLQALVEKGVLTREQAQKMVQDAQTKAQAETAAKAEANKAQEEAEKGAVRVPYVPEIVKDEIRKEVVAELGPSVKKEVVQEISSTGSLRSALPDWIQRMRWTGDIRVRDEYDLFARDNAQNAYLDFNAINAKGGLEQAGLAALLNTSEDRNRLRVRLRFGFDTDLGAGFLAGMRLATGTGEIYPTTNQTLGTYGARYQIAVDQGFIRWNGQTRTARQLFSFTGGRFANPFLSTDLVWYNDLTFEGLTGNYRFNLGSDASHRKDLFLTLGGFPIQDVIPSSNDKWLAAAQIGADFTTQADSRFRIAAAYYDYLRIAGKLNAPDSTLLNYTAPPLFQKGNSVFDIANVTGGGSSLWALAADYKIVDLIAVADWHLFSRYSVTLTGQAVRNVGYKTADVSARIGDYTQPRTSGYRADVGFGTVVPGPWGGWRATVGYRYLERDAVIDAFNDQDFHLGGTDAKGYTITLDYLFNPRVNLRLKYLSANAIDGPPLGVDVWQLDLNTQF